MVAVPAATAVTTPSDTVATLVLLDVHSTVWLALLGATVAVSVSVSPPTVSVASVCESDTLETSGFLTVTVHVAVLSSLVSSVPLVAVAVMVAVPAATAVTTPSDTVATLVLLDVHSTVLSVASSGATVAVSFSVPPPTVMVAVGCESVMPVTSTP